MTTGQFPKRRETDKQAEKRVAAIEERRKARDEYGTWLNSVLAQMKRGRTEQAEAA